MGHRCTSQRVILLCDLSLSPPQVLIHSNPMSSGVEGRQAVCVCVSAAVCSLVHSLTYIFLQINYSEIFNLILSAHLFLPDPSVLSVLCPTSHSLRRTHFIWFIFDFYYSPPGDAYQKHDLLGSSLILALCLTWTIFQPSCHICICLPSRSTNMFYCLPMVIYLSAGWPGEDWSGLLLLGNRWGMANSQRRIQPDRHA